MKYFIPTLLLVLLLCTSGRAQVNWDNIRIETSRNTVVATGGLNLRSAPSTHGKIVAKLPYATKVEVLEEKLYKPDTVNHKYEWTQPYGWAKVRAGRDTGYLYDAYLYYGAPSATLPPKDDWPEGINTSYRLITNQGDAVGSYDPFSFKWYGLFRRQNGYSVQQIKPTFDYFAGEIEESLNMVADTEEQPVFFIGSLKPWPTGLRSEQSINPATDTKDAYQRRSEALCKANGITIKEAKGGSWASAYEFTLTVGDLKQHLQPGGRTRTPMYLEAAADFDGDGKTDFIISYDTADFDLTITYVLFLSSEARAGELVRPVAMEYFYNGC